MGYQTVKQVPTFRDYQHAHQWWEQTKPIRGRSNDLRPLAERRYADCYSIRKNAENQAIECVLYQTPVVTFMPDGEVQVRNNGWATASTHMFMQEILGTGVVRGQRGRSIIGIGGSVFSLGKEEVLRLRKNGLKYEVLNTQVHYDYKINRTAANIVRGRYKEFHDYFKGFIKLRAQEHQGQYYGEPKSMIECTFTELADALGTEERHKKEYLTIRTDDWYGLTKKPNTYHGWRKVPKEVYERTTLAFLDLIKPDQAEETKHTNFHKAVLILLANNHTNITEEKANIGARTTWFMAEASKDVLSETLFKWFADEVLERYEVPAGKVPSNKYTSWVTQENT